MPLADLGVYMRGVRFAMQALAARTRDPWDRSEAERSSRMAERYVTAQGATRRVTGGLVRPLPDGVVVGESLRMSVSLRSCTPRVAEQEC